MIEKNSQLYLFEGFLIVQINNLQFVLREKGNA